MLSILLMAGGAATPAQRDFITKFRKVYFNPSYHTQ